MKPEPNGKEPLFPGLEVPGPPDDLRRQVLDRATNAMGAEPRRDPWARLWESRPARLAWAASILALVAGHVLLPTGNGTAPQGTRLARGDSPARVQAKATRTDGDYRDELSAIADLPKLSLEGRPMAAPVDLDGAGRTVPAKENAS